MRRDFFYIIYYSLLTSRVPNVMFYIKIIKNSFVCNIKFTKQESPT